MKHNSNINSKGYQKEQATLDEFIQQLNDNESDKLNELQQALPRSRCGQLHEESVLLNAE